MNQRHFFAILLLLGSGWGLTIPLSKVAVSEGYEPLGLIFWQMAIGAVALGLFRVNRRKPVVMPRAKLWFFLMVAVLGTVLPYTFSYRAAAHLPAGVMAVCISLVPIFAFPIAMALRTDRFDWLRLGGLAAGLLGVVLLVGPDSLPEAGMALWIPIALVAPLCYGLEGNIVAKVGMQGLGPGHVLFGASVLGAIIALPLAIGSGQFIDPRTEWNAPEFAILAAAVIHVAVYTGYVWLVSQAGAVFASQVAYVVTGMGVIWSMLLLSERYSGWVWASLLLILVGMFMVQPRRKDVLAS
jgi:drug/metabolite transporter (DMT)-like permease